MPHGLQRDALRVVLPQWQACGADYAAESTKNLSPESVRHGYEAGAELLNQILPAADERTVPVPVADYDTGIELGIECRPAVLDNLRAAARSVRERDPERIVTFGGDCSVSVPPLAHLAIVRLDSHTDCATPGGNYPGYHDMALAHITGRGDEGFLAELPATVACDLPMRGTTTSTRTSSSGASNTSHPKPCGSPRRK